MQGPSPARPPLLLSLLVAALIVPTAWRAPAAAAQAPIEEEAPAGAPSPVGMPDVGPPVWAEPVVGSAGFPTATCPTGRNRAEPVGEGYIFKVTGRCDERDALAIAYLKITDLLFPDGEVRFEVKVVSGHDRASVIVGVRDQAAGGISAESDQAVVVPGLGLAALTRAAGDLAVRRDLGGLLAKDDWNAVSLRARGPDLWVLVNDELVAQGADPSYDRGRIFFALRRLGDLEDGAESAAVIRNIRVSGLAGGDPARVPSFAR